MLSLSESTNRSTHTKSPKCLRHVDNLPGLAGFGSFNRTQVGHLYAKAACTASSDPPDNLSAHAKARELGWPKFECRVLMATKSLECTALGIGSAINTDRKRSEAD